MQNSGCDDAVIDDLRDAKAARECMLEGWRLADKLLEHEIGQSKSLLQPISLRHEFLFYLGHLPAFAINTLRLLPAPVRPSIPFDELFSRGIDPDVEDCTKCHPHPEKPAQWPAWEHVLQYKQQVRSIINSVKLPAHYCHIVAEHDLMHVETLCYMLAQNHGPSSHSDKPEPSTRVAATTAATAAAAAHDKAQLDMYGIHAISRDASEHRNGHSPTEWLQVPAGLARLGRTMPTPADQESCHDSAFGWDNEFGPKNVHVPAFSVAKYPVTVAQYLRFVSDGGYREKRYWRQDDWEWVLEKNVEHPASWRKLEHSDGEDPVTAGHPTGWTILTIDGLRSVRDALNWPVFVSLAEARAYASYSGARLPSEEEWDRVAYGDQVKASNVFPWEGHEAVPGVHGNFGMHSRSQLPVDSFPQGKSWIGAMDLVGNGWELTDTVFDSFPGFTEMRLYPQYSRDFFDGKHYVVKGASWATHKGLIRRTFRNFYQAHYPYVFSKFRLAK